MVRQTIVPTIGCVVLLGLIGCSEARLVMRDQYGGVVAIPANSDRWPSYNRKNAEELMSKQCPEGYVIESESEVQTGQRTVVQNGPPRTASSYNVVVAGTQTQEISTDRVTEYRIVFRSKNAPTTVPPLKEGALGAKGLIPFQPTPPPESPPAPAVIQAGGLPKEPLPVNP
jgi:hypothetical protein